MGLGGMRHGARQECPLTELGSGYFAFKREQALMRFGAIMGQSLRITIARHLRSETDSQRCARAPEARSMKPDRARAPHHAVVGIRELTRESTMTEQRTREQAWAQVSPLLGQVLAIGGQPLGDPHVVVERLRDPGVELRH